MNVLLYTAESPYGSLPVGGAETSLRLLAESLASRGHQVIFYTDSRESSFLGFSRKKINGVKVITTNRFNLSWLNYYRVKWLTKKIKNIYLKKILRTNKVQIVHTYYNVEACLRFLDLRKTFPFKFVIRIAGMRPFHIVFERPEFRKGYQKIFQEADLLNFISEGLFQMYQARSSDLELTINEDSYFIKDIGVRVSEASWTYDDSKAHFHCIMVSRFTKYAKRQDLLVKAIALLPKEISIQVTLVGSGKNISSIKELIKSLNVEDKFNLVEFLSQQELSSKILSADLICHACDHEGLSKIIIESMGMGIPVLASDVAPLNTYINDGENGFLSENTPEAWAEKITKIYNKKSELIEVSNQAADFALKHYNASKNVEFYEEEFRKLLNS